MHVGKAMQIADDIADLDEVIRTKKTAGMGSELFLLRCVTAERLAKELFSDIRNMTLHFEKAKELWSSEGIQESLRIKLRKEVIAAQVTVKDLRVSNSEDKELLVSAPREIADIMLRESG